MSNRKRKGTAIYTYDDNGEKVLLGKVRINTDKPEKAQVAQGVEQITQMLIAHHLKIMREKLEAKKVI